MVLFCAAEAFVTRLKVHWHSPYFKESTFLNPLNTKLLHHQNRMKAFTNRLFQFCMVPGFKILSFESQLCAKEKMQASCGTGPPCYSVRAAWTDPQSREERLEWHHFPPSKNKVGLQRETQQPLVRQTPLAPNPAPMPGDYLITGASLDSCPTQRAFPPDQHSPHPSCTKCTENHLKLHQQFFLLFVFLLLSFQIRLVVFFFFFFPFPFFKSVICILFFFFFFLFFCFFL